MIKNGAKGWPVKDFNSNADADLSTRTDITTAVGTAVHSLRMQAAMTLRELARKSDVSPAMISRIENGQVSPSLSTLEALAVAFDVPVISLFQNTVQKSDVAFARSGEGLQARRVAPGHSHDYRILGKFSNKSLHFSVARVTLNRADDGTHPVSHGSGFVTVSILDGACVYACGEERYRMETGDTLTFDAQLRHGVREILADEVTFQTVSSRPA
ncbi:helix-turn-helix domain-containing protein [Albidovulum sp.]|uniref:helix-turn-helix domain-containing protein n=1 Tax=Albidovulum sp. TaxID=1872424 RepID=UPI002D0D47D2|nr:helix-turn-helix domain-containing protein [Albidovulum sp.]